MPQLISISYSKGSDLVEVQALVEDAVQIAPATENDPPQFGSAVCKAVLHWEDPINGTNAPTTDQIKRMLAWIPKEDWYMLPPIDFADE